MSVPVGQSRMIDDIMRRTQWRQRNGLHGELSVQDLIGRLDVVNPRQSDLFEEWLAPAPLQTAARVFPIAQEPSPSGTSGVSPMPPATAEADILAELLSM